MPSTLGRPPKSQRQTLETITQLAAAGETDAANGGVPTNTIADARGICRASIAKHCRRLTDAVELEKVVGVGPSGPRPSYLPADETGGSDR